MNYELEFLFSCTWNIGRNLTTNLQTWRSRIRETILTISYFVSHLDSLLHLSIFTNRVAHQLTSLSSLIESTHPEHLACCDSFIFHSSLAFRCQENGMKKDGEIKSRRRTYSTRSKQCIQQFLSARSFHQIPLPSSPHISPRFDLCPAW